MNCFKIIFNFKTIIYGKLTILKGTLPSSIICRVTNSNEVNLIDATKQEKDATKQQNGAKSCKKDATYRKKDATKFD